VNLCNLLFLQINEECLWGLPYNKNFTRALIQECWSSETIRKTQGRCGGARTQDLYDNIETISLERLGRSGKTTWSHRWACLSDRSKIMFLLSSRYLNIYLRLRVVVVIKTKNMMIYHVCFVCTRNCSFRRSMELIGVFLITWDIRHDCLVFGMMLYALKNIF